MAAFPIYPKILFSDYGEDHSDITERTEMDRGMPKQRKAQSDVIVTVPLKLVFMTKADAVNFEDWYYNVGKAGTVFIDWTDPRTGTLRQIRTVGGTLGRLTPIQSGFGVSQRTLSIEYLRSL